MKTSGYLFFVLGSTLLIFLGQGVSLAEDEEEEKEEIRINDIYYKKEFNYQSFRRSFSLADNAHENKITADYKDGILHIAIDKKKSHNKESHKPSLLRKKE